MFWTFFSLTLADSERSQQAVPQQLTLLSNQTTPVCPKPTWSMCSSRQWNVLQSPAQTLPARPSAWWQASVNKGKRDTNQTSSDLHKPSVHPWLLPAQTSHLFLVLGDKQHIRQTSHFTGEQELLCPELPAQHPQAAPAPFLPPPGLCLTPTAHQGSLLLLSKSILLLNSSLWCCLPWIFHHTVICTQHF